MKKTEKQTGRRGRRLAALALAAVMTLAQAFAPAMTAADRTCGGTAGTWTAFAGEADTEAIPAPAEPAAEETAAPAPQTEAPAEQPEETTPSDQAEQTGAGTEGQCPAPEQSGSGTEAADPAPEQTGSEENAGVQEAEIAAQTSGAAVQAEEAGAQTSGDSEGSGDASMQDAAQAPAMTLAQDGGQALPEEGSESVYEAWTEAGDGETADHLPEETAQAEAAETAEGTGTGAENETAAEAASEAETETGTETETEAEAETETETERRRPAASILPKRRAGRPSWKRRTGSFCRARKCGLRQGPLKRRITCSRCFAPLPAMRLPLKRKRRKCLKCPCSGRSEAPVTSAPT